jgi:protein TonB
MKYSKKLPIKQLEKFSNIFMQLGFVLTLFVVYVTLEYQTEVKPLGVLDAPISIDRTYIPFEQDILFTREPLVVPEIEIPKPDTFILDAPIDKGPVETFLFKEPKEEAPIIINAGVISAVPDPEPDPENDVPFMMIEDAPIFKGCEGLSKEENKACFEMKIKKFVQKNFDTELAQEIGLHSGKHKIYTQFIIDKTGEIIDIRIRAPHVKLKKEVLRIINKIPSFIPGKQRNIPVKVKYVLPITFSIK